MSRFRDIVTPGLPDSDFIRGKVPMTKLETRAIILSKLQLKRDHLVVDLGAGTGSVAVEVALVVNQGMVWAVEKNPDGVDLIRQNAVKFKVENLKVLAGTAPEIIDRLPLVDRAFIGGSGGQLSEILKKIDARLKPEGRVVLTAVTVKTLSQAVETLEEMNYLVDGVLLQSSRMKRYGQSIMWEGLNPVHIIAGLKQQPNWKGGE